MEKIKEEDLEDFLTVRSIPIQMIKNPVYEAQLYPFGPGLCWQLEKMPNAWNRFWFKVAFGWRFEKL